MNQKEATPIRTQPKQSALRAEFEQHHKKQNIATSDKNESENQHPASQNDLLSQRKLSQSLAKKSILDIWAKVYPLISSWEKQHHEVLNDIAAEWQKTAPNGVNYNAIYVQPFPAEFREIIKHELNQGRSQFPDKKMFDSMASQELNPDYMFSDQGTLILIETHANQQDDAVSFFRIPDRSMIDKNEKGMYGFTSVGVLTENINSQSKVIKRYEHLFKFE